MKNQRNFTAILLLLLVINFNLTAQENNTCANGPSEGSYKWAYGVTTTSIPFELVGNLVVIPIEINGEITKFILDTGMPAMGGLITNSKKAAKLNLNYIGEAQIGGAGGGFSKAKVAAGINFNIGNIEFYNQTLVVLPESKNLSYFETDGVIGNEILTRFIVDINYDNQTIRLAEPSNYKPIKDAEEIKISFESVYPFVKSSAILDNGTTVPLNLVLDLGASHALSLLISSQKSIVLPDKNIKVSTGRGINTEVFGYMGRIKNFKIGSYSFDNPIVSFNDQKLVQFEKEGNLGSGILKRFNITFDYPNKRFFIKPNKSYSLPFEFNMAGIQISKVNNEILKIDRVLPYSTGLEAGLLQEDIILRINKVNATEITKGELKKIFEKENELVELEIKRGDLTKTVSVKLSRII